MRFGAVVGLNDIGFLVVQRNQLDIFEWDEDSESLVKTALVQKEALQGIAVLGLNEEDLNCS